jgi:hypothetical protein
MIPVPSPASVTSSAVGEVWTRFTPSTAGSPERSTDGSIARSSGALHDFLSRVQVSGLSLACSAKSLFRRQQG